MSKLLLKFAFSFKKVVFILVPYVLAAACLAWSNVSVLCWRWGSPRLGAAGKPLSLQQSPLPAPHPGTRPVFPPTSFPNHTAPGEGLWGPLWLWWSWLWTLLCPPGEQHLPLLPQLCPGYTAELPPAMHWARVYTTWLGKSQGLQTPKST